jgi:hypothetical protein
MRDLFWLRVSEAAEELRVGPGTVRRWAAYGWIKTSTDVMPVERRHYYEPDVTALAELTVNAWRPTTALVAYLKRRQP